MVREKRNKDKVGHKANLTSSDLHNLISKMVRKRKKTRRELETGWKMKNKRVRIDLQKIEWPWERNRNPVSIYGFDKNFSHKSSFSTRCYENRYLDLSTKRAAIKSSESVVSLVTYSDDKELFQGSGIIIEESGTILTSVKLVTCPGGEKVVAKNLKVVVYTWDGKPYDAQLLAYDFYYYIAVIKIQGNVSQLKPAFLRRIDDQISVDPSERFQLRPHSPDFNLVPGDNVIAIGRHFIKPYDLMAAPGIFSTERSEDGHLKRYECKELFTTTCLITESGIGGPLVNHHGEVIGLNLYRLLWTPFVPINIVLKWWKHIKDHKKLRQRPLLGMELASYYNANLLVMEKLILKVPNYVTGVIVEDVVKRSPADRAGICPNDLIVECSGKHVRSFLELFDMMWDHAEDSVDLAVFRFIDGARLNLTLKVVDARFSDGGVPGLEQLN